MLSSKEKVRENRLRRMADRQGLRLLRSRARDPRSLTYGGYMIVDVATSGAVCGYEMNGYSATLDEAEAYLTA